MGSRYHFPPKATWLLCLFMLESSLSFWLCVCIFSVYAYLLCVSFLEIHLACALYGQLCNALMASDHPLLLGLMLFCNPLPLYAVQTCDLLLSSKIWQSRWDVSSLITLPKIVTCLARRLSFSLALRKEAATLRGPLRKRLRATSNQHPPRNRGWPSANSQQGIATLGSNSL